MVEWLKKLNSEKAYVMQGITSLLLLIITVLVCSINKGTPEEKGVISAAICISSIIFINITSTLVKEGVEGILFAFIGSFIVGVTIIVVGSRLAFDPAINSYFFASLSLSSILSLSSNLYLIPEKLDPSKIKLSNLGLWILITLLSIIINFTIIYWVPKII